MQRRNSAIQLRGNIFSDPRGWARQAIGTPFRYRVIQANLVLSSLVIVIIFLGSTKHAPHDSGWWIHFACLCAFVFNGVLLWPLMLLRALQAWVPPIEATQGFEVVPKEDTGPAAGSGIDRLYVMRLAFLFIVTLAVAGCSMPVVKPQMLAQIQTSSSFHPLFYVGSDKHYHYFRYLNLKVWEDYRVARADLKMPEEFEKGQGESQVMWPGTLEKAMAR